MIPNNSVSLKKSFAIFNNFSLNCICAAGGTMNLIRGLIHSCNSFNSNLQVTAVYLTLHKAITICLYIPLDVSVTHQELDNLVNKVASYFILMEDFNGHNLLLSRSNHDT